MTTPVHEMNLLALETTTDACSVAVLHEGQIHEWHEIAPQQHAQKMLNWISELLFELDLTLTQMNAIAYSCGPGSFTGIRISAAIVQGLMLGTGAPIIGVSSLQVIAQGVHREYNKSHVMVVQDARMGQVYQGYYVVGRNGIMDPDRADSLCDPNEITISNSTLPLTLVGDAFKTYSDLLALTSTPSVSWEYIPNFYPHAQDVGLLALNILNQGTSTTSQTMPIYLRNQSAWKKAK